MRVNEAPKFIRSTPKLIEVKPDNKYIPRMKNEPLSIELNKNKYLLLGFTIFYSGHFRIILYSGKEFFLIDDLSANVPEKVNEIKSYEEIGSIFYYCFDLIPD